MGRREAGGKGIHGWRKLHLGVNDAGLIVAQLLTDSNLDDATAGVDLIGQVNASIATVIAEAESPWSGFPSRVPDPCTNAATQCSPGPRRFLQTREKKREAP